MKILFVSSEGLPYSKTGGLADVIEGLPLALRAAGHDVAVLLPRYRGNKTTSTIVSSVTTALGDQLRFPAIAEGQPNQGVRYFFVDDPQYFDRAGLYGDKGGDYPDNAERFAEFCRVAIEFTKRVWLPDVIHCHDWQTGLVPLLLRTQYVNDPTVRSLPVVLTIHNIGYQGHFPANVLPRIGLPMSLFTAQHLEFFGQVNLLKGGLLYADYLTTVSPTYAKEIQTLEFGWALDGVIRDRGDRLVGILNGVDYGIWSPEADRYIPQNYSVHNMAGKAACKRQLIEQVQLPPESFENPIIGIVSRFVDQKGFDLIAQAAAELMKENVTIVALGTGQPEYERLFQDLESTNPNRVRVKIGYDDSLAHRIEAGADMFLMPSRYEPCGLSQIYSLRYGTVPIVRATGGLDDTVENFDPNTKRGTGFKFGAYTGQALLEAVRAAVRAYHDPSSWQALQANGMTKDFSWHTSAAAYVSLYEAAKRSRIPIAVGTSKRY
jgi:starch synthase